MKIKQIYLVLMLVLSTVFFAGCTHNGGDIGKFFGIWRLDNISAHRLDEEGMPAYSVESVDSVFWSFQSDVVMMQRLLPYHEYDRRWGTWSEGDGELSLNFTHSGDGIAPGTGMYHILEGLYLPSDGKVVLKIKEMDKLSMVLTYDDLIGETRYTYYFTKW